MSVDIPPLFVANGHSEIRDGPPAAGFVPNICTRCPRPVSAGLPPQTGLQATPADPARDRSH
ncbi:MAG TPA: hypothetical protein VG796_18485 [Verrucomicrobiales bacterium]|nr:hypothetical protein [Verrucomicrobiales bacterium]